MDAWLHELPRRESYSMPPGMAPRACDLCGSRDRLRLDHDLYTCTWRVVCQCGPLALDNDNWYSTPAEAILQWAKEGLWQS